MGWPLTPPGDAGAREKGENKATAATRRKLAAHTNLNKITTMTAK